MKPKQPIFLSLKSIHLLEHLRILNEREHFTDFNGILHRTERTTLAKYDTPEALESALEGLERVGAIMIIRTGPTYDYRAVVYNRHPTLSPHASRAGMIPGMDFESGWAFPPIKVLDSK